MWPLVLQYLEFKISSFSGIQVTQIQSKFLESTNIYSKKFILLWYSFTFKHLKVSSNRVNNNNTGSCNSCSLTCLLPLFCCRMLAPEIRMEFEPITVKTHPFQQTSQPEEFNMGTFSSAIFIGMSFVLVPVSLAVDMVYDREASILETERNREWDNAHVYWYIYCIYRLIKGKVFPFQTLMIQGE